MDDASLTASLSFQSLLGSLLLGDWASLAQSLSEAKSGSFFYQTADGRYILKTVSDEEAKCLLTMLGAYHSHMSQTGPSMLMQILGLFALEGDGTKKVYFILTNNVLGRCSMHSDDTQRYDLKGSSFLRSAKNPEHSSVSTNPNRLGEIGCQYS